MVSEDPYTGPQPGPDAPPTEQTAPDPSPRTAATPTPVAAAVREPLSFWGHAWATAFGIALSIPILIIGAIVVLTALSETLPD